MSQQVSEKVQATFGAALTVSVLHHGDDDPKAKHPYALCDSYFIEFEGDPEDLIKAIAKLPMVEQAFKLEIKQGYKD